MARDTTPKNIPPFYAHAPETSREAAESMVEAAPTREAKVLALANLNGPYGCTADEVEAAFEWERRSSAPRIASLKKLGKIVDSGIRRKGRSGRNQAAWVLPEYAPPPADDGQDDLPGLAA